MLVKVLLICNTIGLVKLTRHIDHHGYHNVPMHGSKGQSHETPTDTERALLEGEGSWEAAGHRADVPDYLVSITYPHQGEREQLEAAGPPSQNGNWCSYTQSRLVTYIEACMKEKYIVNSQQPCPNGAPGCQKIMYRTAVKPIYQVKQKVLKSLQWKCCPGFIGNDCEQRDPNVIPVPGNQTEGWQEEEFSNHMSAPVDSRELLEVIQNQEALLDDLQSDIHQAVSNLGDLQRIFDNNGTSMVLEVNQSSEDFQERLLQQVLFPHIESFLRKHLNPMWASFNRSLQNLSNIVRNLSHDVEANKKSIERFQESTVPKKEFQELGTKFESKVQENVVKVDQIRREIENQLQMQQASLQHNLTIIRADTDTRLKKHHKIQQSHHLALNNNMTSMKREQNNLENKFEALKNNLTELSSHHGPKDESTLFAIRQINDMLAGHAKQLKELYMESDVAFQNIAVLEKWFKELKKNISKNRPEDLSITLTEKSVLIEENKAAMSQMNDTLSALQENYSELLRYMEECNCQKIPSDPDILEEDLRNNTYSLEGQQPKDMKQLESVFKDLLRNEIEELSSAFPLIHQSLNLRQEENRQLQLQVASFSEDVGLLKKKDEEIHRHIKYLNSSFGSLLEDAMRHEAALEALLGEEFMEVLFEEDPATLITSVAQLQEFLKEISNKLQNQNTTLESLLKRFHRLERGQQNNHNVHASSKHPKQETQTLSVLDEGNQLSSVEHMEPNYEASKDDSSHSSAYNDILTLKNDIKYLSLAIKRHESRSDVSICCNHTIANVVEPLNTSVEIISGDLATMKEKLEKHLLVFKKLFGRDEELLASNVSLDIAKIQSMLTRKVRRQEKGQDKQRDKKKPEKQRENTPIVSGRNRVQTELLEKDSPVAFHVGFSDRQDKEKALRLNETYLNYGNSYFPEHGYFKAPHKGVYLFIISVEFSSGPALGQLSFSRGYKRTLSSGQRKTPNGNTVTSFAMAEMEKGEKVCFELLQGTVVKRSPPGTTMGGFLLFKT
ncbi:multimerin-2 [Coturnix japonica]|uniref:Multimerin 2 n=1 Tax=Coturnix japonica TaxID=93934 RepID=A0A8C2TJN9_COTJA|nr:multimerin-2 [Coturnix japonica]